MKKPDTLDDFPTNLSANEHFQSVVARAVSRRGFLKSGLGLSAAAFLSGSLAACTSDDDASVAPSPSSPPAVATPLLSFEGIPTSTADDIVVAAGYTATVFAPWGTPLFSSGPGSSWAGDASEGAAEQARQVGDNHDGLHFFPLTEGNNDEGLLVMNHEYTNVRWLFANGQVDSLDDANKDLNAHGVSVIHIRRTAGRWEIVTDSAYNRRITGNTPMLLTGPAAGDTLLQTNADPTGTLVFGTLNNCGNGYTPWGTYLTCEENFNQYFGTLNTLGTARNAAQVRYGLDSNGTERKYEQYVPRFDWQLEPNESNRFGWIVEIDPFDPRSTPKKRTALGRIKHENAAYRIGADGTVSASQPDQPGVVNVVAQLKLVNPPEAGLVRGDDGLFRLQGGAAAPADPNVRVAGGYLEGSNVNVVDQMVQMISLARQFEMQTRMLSTAEQNDRAAARVLGGQG